MRAWNTTLLPVLLALLIGALPPAFAVASDAPAAGAHQEVQAAAHSAAAAGHQVAAEGHGAAAAGHGDAHGSDPLSPEKLKDLFWRTVNFLALVIILVKFGAKPIMSGLSGRQQQIREELADLTARRDEAERSYHEFEAKLAGMEKEMELIVERAIAQAQVEKERILADAEKAADDIKRQAEAAVQAELEDAKRRLREEIADQAAAMAEELIVKNLTPADQVAITEQYLERVGAVQ
ncbi:ATP synthase F0 subunit B [Desulfobulbus elongatus]|uniref:ATP synthase F0 subunit B n=1 Tax=Desulfobulbus elongatus TaxID=53332 RepID=UPI000A067B34|nr:ATP synthase F0 subunit B [Desulfobulbus elongatus]